MDLPLSVPSWYRFRLPLDCSWHMAVLRMKFQLRQAVVASHRAAHAELSVVAEGEPSGVP